MSESKSEHSWLKVLQKLNYLLYQQTSHTHKKKNNSVISSLFFPLIVKFVASKIISSKCLIPLQGDPGKILSNRRVRLNLEAFIYSCINNCQGTISM